jgi:two-component system response regulator YesN
MMTIMLVDDEESTREIVSSYLNRNLEYRVVAQAGNGTEALEKLEKSLPDVVITDICMPTMDGLELARQIRLREYPAKVIIMSGYSDFEYAQKAIKYEVEDYLLKPFLPSTLESLLCSIEKKLESERYARSNRKQTRENFLGAMVKGELKAEEIHKGAEIFLLPTCGNSFMIGALRFFLSDCPTGPTGVWDRFRQLFLDQLPSSLHAVCFMQGKDRATILVSYDECKEKECKESLAVLFESISKELESSCNRSVWCGFSPPFGSLCQAQEANTMASLVWKRTFSLAARCSFYSKTTDIDMAQTIASIRKLENAYTLALSLGSESALVSLDSIFGQLEQLGLYDYHSMQVQLLSLVVKISILMDTNQMDHETLDDFTKYLNNAKTLGSLFETRYMLKKVSETVWKAKRSANLPTSEIIIDTIKKTVRKNLTNEFFTVDDALEGLNYSHSYIRHIFGQREGMSIKEYIIGQRMERAKLLLQDSTIPIKEIARQTGYRNQRYFSFGFKEFCGISPTTWRKEQSMNK